MWVIKDWKTKYKISIPFGNLLFHFIFSVVVAAAAILSPPLLAVSFCFFFAFAWFRLFTGIYRLFNCSCQFMLTDLHYVYDTLGDCKWNKTFSFISSWVMSVVAVVVFALARLSYYVQYKLLHVAMYSVNQRHRLHSALARIVSIVLTHSQHLSYSIHAHHEANGNCIFGAIFLTWKIGTLIWLWHSGFSVVCRSILLCGVPVCGRIYPCVTVKEEVRFVSFQFAYCGRASIDRRERRHQIKLPHNGHHIIECHSNAFEQFLRSTNVSVCGVSDSSSSSFVLMRILYDVLNPKKCRK